MKKYEIISTIKKYKLAIITFMFFIFLMIQHNFVFMYHDDYGYASLSYANVINGVIGVNFNLSQLFEFLGTHYMSHGGRILYFLIECIMLKNGLFAFRLIQSIIIALIFYFILKLVNKNTKEISTSTIVVTYLLYGILSLETYRTGIYWVSASVLYLFPILPLFIGVYLRNDIEYYHNKKYLYIIICILFFMAGFSQEQIAIIAVVYCICIFVKNLLKNKKTNKIDLAILISSTIGAVILYIAPGNYVRATSDIKLTSIGFLFNNLKRIIEIYFGSFNYRLCLVLFLLVTYIGYYLLKNRKGFKYLNIALIIISLFFFVITLYDNFILKSQLFNIESNKVILISFAYLILTIFSIMQYLYYNKKICIMYLFIGGALSQCSTIIFPYIIERMTIPFIFILFIVIIDIVNDFVKNESKTKVKLAQILIITFIGAMSMQNSAKILSKYYINSFIHKYNNQILIETSDAIRKGEVIQEINLQEIPDPLYSGDMSDFVMFFLKEYYHIPKDVKINYPGW